MKVEDLEKEEFKHVSMTITIETQRELDAIRHMLEFDCTIPQLVKPEYKEIVEDFIMAMHHILDNK